MVILKDPEVVKDCCENIIHAAKRQEEHSTLLIKLKTESNTHFGVLCTTYHIVSSNSGCIIFMTDSNRFPFSVVSNDIYTDDAHDSKILKGKSLGSGVARACCGMFCFVSNSRHLNISPAQPPNLLTMPHTIR